jgi:hypothetical protein
MREVIDFVAARFAREQIVIAVAGLIDANPLRADAEAVAEFAYETRWHRDNRGVDFYADTLRYLHAEHAAALQWAHNRLSHIDGWRSAICGRAPQ